MILIFFISKNIQMNTGRKGLDDANHEPPALKRENAISVDLVEESLLFYKLKLGDEKFRKLCACARRFRSGCVKEEEDMMDILESLATDAVLLERLRNAN